MKAYVVVPNWNGEEFLGPCLDSLMAQDYKDFEIMVVDNGSTDGSVELLRRRYPQIKLIELDRNYGFTGGVNPGFEAAMRDEVEFVAAFNNDAIADKSWLSRLVQGAEMFPEVGIFAAKILQEDGKLIDSTGDLYSVWGFPFPRGRDEVDRGQYDSPEMQTIFGASGGASLYRVAMLKKIGLFDQDFFAYYEDQDISFRAQLAGWKVRYEPQAVVFHRMGGTSSRLGRAKNSVSPASEPAVGFKPNNFARYHSIKNFYFLYVKNMPGWLFWKYLPRFVTGFILIVGNSAKRRQFGPLTKALGQIIVKTPAIFAKRWKVQRQRKVSTNYIDSILYKNMPPTQKSLLKLRRRLLGH